MLPDAALRTRLATAHDFRSACEGFMMKYVPKVGSAFAGAAVVATVQSLFIDPEMLGASLIVSLLVLPSIATFAFVERLRCRFRGAKDLLFALSIIPLTIWALILIKEGGEASDMAEFIGACYLSQALAAYWVLLATSTASNGTQLD